MVGQAALNRSIGVRLPVSQPPFRERMHHRRRADHGRRSCTLAPHAKSERDVVFGDPEEGLAGSAGGISLTGAANVESRAAKPAPVSFRRSHRV